jgi:adenylate cyclase
LCAWLTQAGLAGVSESEILSGMCERCAGSGIPLARTQLLIDTLHPVHEGRLFRWRFGPDEPPVIEYGRTNLELLAASAADPKDIESAKRWLRNPFYLMLQTGDSILRRRLSAAAGEEFSFLPDWVAAGMTEYVAIITRFAAEGVIDFGDPHVAAIERVTPFLALAIKSVSLARMTTTLMETYLGRDPGRRVLAGRIVRGLAEEIDAVVWFSDLAGFTRITDTTPEQVIPC